MSHASGHTGSKHNEKVESMKPILDRGGHVVGYTVEVGDRHEVRSRSNTLIAWYNKRSDKTFKRDGNLAGFGNQAIKFSNEE